MLHKLSKHHKFTQGYFTAKFGRTNKRGSLETMIPRLPDASPPLREQNFLLFRLKLGLG